MATNQDYLLQQILNNNISMNDNLTGMRDLLAELLKQGKKKPPKNDNGGNGNGGNGGGGGGTGDRARDDRRNRDEGAGPYSKMFKDLFGEAKNVSNTMLGTAGTVSSTVGSFGKSASVVAGSMKMIPGPVGAAAQAFSLIVDAGMAVYDYLNAQLEMYNKINSSGIKLSDGMVTLRKGAASAHMSMDDFGVALSSNSEAISGMSAVYGNGTEAFGNLIGSMNDLQAAGQLYGVTQEQLAGLTARNFKFQKLYGTTEALRNANQVQSTDMFVSQMVQLSRAVGKSVDELTGRFDDLSKSVNTRVISSNLQNRYGLDRDVAAETTKNMNEAFASMGDVGKQLNVLASHRLNIGGVPEELDNFMTQAIADRMEDAARKGIKRPSDFRRYMDDWVTKNQKDLELEVENMLRAGNEPVANLLSSLLESSATMDKNAASVNPIIEQFTTKFNNWVSNTFTEPFNKMYADTQLSAAKYLLEVSENTDSAMGFAGQLAKDALKAIPGTVNSGLLYLQNLFDDLTKTILGDSANSVNTAFNNFINNLVELPSELWKSILSWWDSSSSEKAEGAKSAISSVFSTVGDTFEKLKSMDFDYTDMKGKIQSSFESMKTKIGSWWDTAKGWFNDDPIPAEAKNQSNNPSINNNVNPNLALQTSKIQEQLREQPAVVSNPQITKPERIEEATEVAPVTSEQSQTMQPVNYDEAIVSLLGKLNANSEQQSMLSQQMAGFMRTISENTEAQRNS